MPRRSAIAYAGVAVVFVATCLPFFGLPPGSDGWKNLWLIQNVPPWRFLFDPLAAGYVFRFYFEPVWAVSFYPDVLLAPWLGNGAYHIVNLVAVGAMAAAIASVSGAARRATTPAVLLVVLASPIFWFTIGMTPARNYLLGTVFALLALRPFWRACERNAPVSRREALTSAAFYALAIACKEAMASWPALLFLLDLRVRRRPAASAAVVVPHAVALVGLFIWRWHILGGLGGYWMQPEFSPANLGIGFVMLGELLWGTWWPIGAVLVAGVVVIGVRRDAAWLAVACLVAALPFTLAGDLAAGGFRPVGAARLVLPWSVIAIFLVRATANLGKRSLPIAAIAGLLLAGAHWAQRPIVADGLHRALPVDRLADEALRAEGPVAVISNGSMGLAFRHQLRPEPKAPLASYQSPPSYLLDVALGGGPPDGAATVRIRDDWTVSEMVPLDLAGSRIWADASGHFRARFAPGVIDGLTLTWFHENGSTRWVATLPIGRRTIDLPLSYSVRRVVLARFRVSAQGYDRWEIHVWESPFFRPKFP